MIALRCAVWCGCWLVLQTASAEPAPAGSYWRQSTWVDPERGFLWYGPQRRTQPPKPLADMGNKELGAALEQLLQAAVEQPTPETVEAYLRAQQVAMERATLFSDVFRRTVWAVPELDYALRGRPVNALALAGWDAGRETARRAASQALAATHGIFFYFRSDCPYCHQLAPIVKEYQRQFGVEVFAISLDGGSLPDFPDARPDNGSARRLALATVPALFLADRRSGALQPLGFGMLSLEDLIQRVHTLTLEPGKEY